MGGRVYTFLLKIQSINSFVFYGEIWCRIQICDVIKQNESELANTVFKIQLNKATCFFCFLLFLQNISYICIFRTNCSITMGFSNTQIGNAKKLKTHTFRLQTHFVWSHHIFMLLFLPSDESLGWFCAKIQNGRQNEHFYTKTIHFESININGYHMFYAL